MVVGFFNSGALPIVLLLDLMIFPCGLNGKDVVTAWGWLKIKDSLWVLLLKREEIMLFRELCCYFRAVW